MIPRNRSDWWMLALAVVSVLVVAAFDARMESQKTPLTAERVGEASGRVTKHFSKGFVRGLTSKEAATNEERR